jgi:hypothetical protein
MAYGDDVDLLWDKINTTKKTGTLICASNDVGLERNFEKDKYVLSPEFMAKS